MNTLACSQATKLFLLDTLESALARHVQVTMCILLKGCVTPQMTTAGG